MSGLSNLVSPSKKRATLSNQRVPDTQVAAQMSSSEAKNLHSVNDETDEDQPRRIIKRKSKTVVLKQKGFAKPHVSLQFDYSKFHEAFRRSFDTMPAPPVIAESADSSQEDTESQLPDAGDHLSDSLSKRNGFRSVPAKRAGAVMASSSKRVKSNKRSPLTVEERPLTSAEGPAVEKKAPSKGPKGSGIYKTGTWEYVTEDTPPAEQITKVVNEISNITEAATEKPMKITRHQFLKMKSKIYQSSPSPAPTLSQEPPQQPGNATVVEKPAASESTSPARIANAIDPALEPSVSARRSSRKRPIPNYSLVPELDEEPPTPAESPSNRPAKRQKTDVMHELNVPQSSKSAAGQAIGSRRESTATSSHPEAEQSMRPKLSWTMIVYEVIANSKTPTLSLAEIIEGVKDRFPYFRSKTHALTLKSSTRNPIYKHPAFYRLLRADGTVACGLNAGDFYDVKSNKLLTAGLPVSENTPTTQASNPIGEKNPRKAISLSKMTGSDKKMDEEDTTVEAPSDGPIVAENTNIVPPLRPSLSGTNEEARLSDTDNDRQSPSSNTSSTQPSTLSAEVNEGSPAAATIESVTAKVDSPSREERLSHEYLAETFTTDEMNRFHQEAQRVFFKRLELNQGDISRILSDIFPIWLSSSDNDLEECARDLQGQYEEDIWGSEMFLEFVMEEVTKFDTLMSMNYMDKDRPARSQFWLGFSKWNRQKFNSLFSSFKNAVDLDTIWNNKHWHDYATKLYATACDATWDHRLRSGIEANPQNVYATIRAVLNERYPDKSAKIWEVPRNQEEPAARKKSVSTARGTPCQRIAPTPPPKKSKGRK